MSHALCSSSGSPIADRLRLELLRSLSSLCTVSLHRLNKRARASQLTVLLGAALPRYSASAAQTEAAGRRCFLLQSGERDKSFRWGFCSNMPRSCDHNPFFPSLCFQTKASACDRESDFLCSLFMQLNHVKTSKLIWQEWHALFLEKNRAVRYVRAMIGHLRVKLARAGYSRILQYLAGDHLLAFRVEKEQALWWNMIKI